MSKSWADLMTFVARGQASPHTLYVSTAAGALTLSLDGAENYSFDGEGRLIGAWRERLTYRRALDNRVLVKWQDEATPGRRLRRFLGEEERRALMESVYARVSEAAYALASGALAVDPDCELEREFALHWLDRVGGWHWQRLENEAQRFSAVYRPVPILPPDQYLSLVIQATEGCSYNACTFCTFYRDRPFRIQTLESLAQHTEDVLDFLGRGVEVRRSLFLADANAIIIPQARLLPMMDALNDRLPLAPEVLDEAGRRAGRTSRPWSLDGIYAFISAPDALRKSAGDFADLRQRNLRRVYVGLESGHDPLRRFLHKQGSASDVLEAVRTIKEGGVGVGVIVMVGIGGEGYREAHGRDTAALLERMPLGAGDIVYLSPFVSSGDTEYDRSMAEAGLLPLTEDVIRTEENRLKASLAPLAKRTGARLSHYDLREFVY